MKKKILTTAVLLAMLANANAQIYGGESVVRYPTTNLYDPGIMNMYMRAYAETYERRATIFKEYASQAVDAFNEGEWGDAIKYATSALSLFENGQQYYIRGYAYESLGYLKEAKRDYKKSKKHGYPDAAQALESVSEKIKAQRKRK